VSVLENLIEEAQGLIKNRVADIIPDFSGSNPVFSPSDARAMSYQSKVNILGEFGLAGHIYLSAFPQFFMRV